MNEPDREYTICLAFDSRPLVTCFGFDGIAQTIPRLEPNLYAIRDRRGRLVGDATVSPNGEWWLEVEGVKAGPGYIIV